jgi:PPOX class probable F420-dependent enzyme
VKELPDAMLELLRGTGPAQIATLMPDGSPQLTQVWVDTDGTNILVNSVQGHQKVRNVERDPRVAVTVGDPDAGHRYFGARGEVVGMTTEGAVDHIEALAQRYTGRPYAWYGGRDQVRVLLTIAPRSVYGQG